MSVFCDFCLDNIKHGWVTPCDGSGVVATTDWPESRVAVCPAWPIDEPDPLAYEAAIDGLGYAQMPATMRQRIRDNVIAEMEHAHRTEGFAPYLDEPADELRRVPMIVSAFVLALITLAVLAGIFYPWGGLA